MNQQEYYKIGEANNLPKRCPILNLCRRRALSIYYFTYQSTDPNVDVYDFLISTGDFPKDFKTKYVELQGEPPSIRSGNSHYLFNHVCPEVNLFDDENRLIGFDKSACTKGEWDKYFEGDKHRHTEFKHYSDCAEFSFYMFNQNNKLKMNSKDIINTNNNTNNNNVNISFNVDELKQIHGKKELKPNWYKRTIIGGVITLILSISGYYIKKKIDEKSSVSPATTQVPIEGKKQN